MKVLLQMLYNLISNIYILIKNRKIFLLNNKGILYFYRKNKIINNANIINDLNEIPTIISGYTEGVIVGFE